MAYSWIDGMNAANADPALEPHYRAAIIAACNFLEEHLEPLGAQVPVFVRGWFSSPKNDSAKAMVLEIDRAMPAPPTGPGGSVRQQIIAQAERSAFVVRAAGFGDAGWAAFARTLVFSHNGPRRAPIPVPVPS